MLLLAPFIYLRTNTQLYLLKFRPQIGTLETVSEFFIKLNVCKDSLGVEAIIWGKEYSLVMLKSQVFKLPDFRRIGVYMMFIIYVAFTCFLDPTESGFNLSAGVLLKTRKTNFRDI